MEEKKVALITGASLRLGRAISLLLASKNYHLVLHYNKNKAAAIKLQKDLANDYAQNGQLFFVLKEDFSAPKKIDSFYQKAFTKFKKIDLLVNNAACFFPDTIKKFKTQNLCTAINTNALSPLLLIQNQINQNESSQIINILDSRIDFFDSNYFSYSLSKKTFFEGIKLFLANTNNTVRINSIAPGAIIAPSEKNRDLTLSKNKLIKGIDRTSQVLNAIEFFLNNDYINGETLFLDGKTRFNFR